MAAENYTELDLLKSRLQIFCEFVVNYKKLKCSRAEVVFKRYETAGSKGSYICVHFRNTMQIYAENLTREQN